MISFFFLHFLLSKSLITVRAATCCYRDALEGQAFPESVQEGFAFLFPLRRAVGGVWDKQEEF